MDRLFKSVDPDYDPRKIGTIRIGSLAFYRRHYNEAVQDEGEGKAVLTLNRGEAVTLTAEAAAAVMPGIKFWDAQLRLGGTTRVPVDPSGLAMEFDNLNRKVTFSGGAKFEFEALDCNIFSMTLPKGRYRDAFGKGRTVWSIPFSSAEEFAKIVAEQILYNSPLTASFPFLSPHYVGESVISVEHSPVLYTSRDAVLGDPKAEEITERLFQSSAFIKPKGPPRNFQNEEEYRFIFMRGLPNGGFKPRVPAAIDIPFEPIRHLVSFH